MSKPIFLELGGEIFIPVSAIRSIEKKRGTEGAVIVWRSEDDDTEIDFEKYNELISKLDIVNITDFA